MEHNSKIVGQLFKVVSLFIGQIKIAAAGNQLFLKSIKLMSVTTM